MTNPKTPVILRSLLCLSAFLCAANPASQLITHLESGQKQVVVAYGTSLTANGAWVKQVADVLEKRYPGLVTLINRGGSGQWSQWGVENLDQRVLQNKPDTVFIEFSINDSVARFKGTVELARTYLETMVERIQGANPTCEIILMTMTPGDQYPEGHKSYRKNIAAHYEMYRSVAKQRGLLLIDHDPNWRALQANDKRRFLEYVPDTIHPTALGCSMIVTPVILEALGFKEARHGSETYLAGWGGGKAEDVVPKAAEVGFAELVVHHEDTANFTKFIELGKQHGIGIYAWMFLGDIQAWKKVFPEADPPLQVMSTAEQEVLKSSQMDKTPGKSNNQFGGEPVNPIEVLEAPLLCFHDPRVLETFMKQIDEMLSVPGVKGVALDYIGYRNYRCCRCETSQRQLAIYREQHPELSPESALNQFSLATLVDFNNRLSAYVRKVKPDARVITHVYPVYLPEPLYGNRLDVDVCAQTAAWFFEPFWSAEKIKSYSHIIAKKANQFHRRPQGAALIGVAKYPHKSVERLTAEIQAILDGGCSRVHVCSFNDVLAEPDTAGVFRRFFSKQDRHQE